MGDLGDCLCQAPICTWLTRMLWLRRERGPTSRCTARRPEGWDQNGLSEFRDCALCYIMLLFQSLSRKTRMVGWCPHSPGTVCRGALWAVFLGLAGKPKACGVNG